MLLVTGAATVDPDHRERAVELATEMAEATRAEPGCLEYRFSSDLTDPNTVYIFERWESMDDLEAHFETDHMARFQTELPPLLAGEMDIALYEIAGERDLF